MSWLLRYRFRIFLRSSLWAAPLASIAAAIVAAPLLRAVDARTHWTLLTFGPEGSRAVIGALASSLLTFIVFAFSMILLAVQVASGQLTPRIIGRIFESRLTKVVLSVFAFSFSYTLAVLGRIEDHVPQFSVLIAFLSSLLSITLFLYLIQQASQSLRPVIILGQVADDTSEVIRAVYPRPFTPDQDARSERDLDSARPMATIVHRGRSGAVLAFDAAGLVELATRANCTIELIPRVGDFLITGEDIFRVYGERADIVDDAGLRRRVAVGQERDFVEDPVLGFRILVDIAVKALSTAINDPSTAVLAIDQIHNILQQLGQRQLKVFFGIPPERCGSSTGRPPGKTLSLWV
jgi:uncharacterized membrane protein